MLSKSVSCVPSILHLYSMVLSPDSRSATACCPTAPGGAAGAEFCADHNVRTYHHILMREQLIAGDFQHES
jgi:hypothetical protein